MAAAAMEAPRRRDRIRAAKTCLEIPGTEGNNDRGGGILHWRPQLSGGFSPQKCYELLVTDISGRELRDNLSQVLRRVEAGERLRVTVGGRPVAELRPLPQPPRPRTMSWKNFVDRA